MDRMQKRDTKPGHPLASRLFGKAKSAERGRSRGGTITKITALADALGNLVDFRLLPVQVHDLRGTPALIGGLSCGQFLADRAFDANWVPEALDVAEIEAVIPPKSNRRFPTDCDRDTYKWHHLIENFFRKF